MSEFGGEPEFRVGEMVHLRCHGPAMVVAKVMHGGEEGFLYEALWHDEVGSLNREVLPEAALVPHVPKEEWES